MFSYAAVFRSYTQYKLESKRHALLPGGIICVALLRQKVEGLGLPN